MENIDFIGVDGYTIRVGSCASESGSFAHSKLTVDFVVGSNKKVDGLLPKDFDDLIDQIIKFCVANTKSPFVKRSDADAR